MKCYNSVFKITKSKLLKKNYSFITYFRCKLIKIVRSTVIKGYLFEKEILFKDFVDYFFNMKKK